MIQVRNVSRVYPNSGAALSDVSLEIAAQEVVAITGPSGCGKSTLLHLLGGLDRPDCGELVVDGVALHTASEQTLTEYRRLVHEPRLLLADEPTGNLDSANASQVMELLQGISSHSRTTMLVVTHSADMARIASRIIRMHDGKILPLP